MATTPAPYWPAQGQTEQPFAAASAFGALPVAGNTAGFAPHKLQTFSLQGAPMKSTSAEFSPVGTTTTFNGNNGQAPLLCGAFPVAAPATPGAPVVFSATAREFNPFAASPAKPVAVNPFQQAAFKASADAESFVPQPPTPNVDLSTKSFVERSMYKRELCKNWLETNFCRFGSKCQYAHGEAELSDNHPLYVSEQQKAGINDKYKSQNCRQFYREKYCPYGKRCHFRHEYRSFKKIHRHFYMAHLAAMSLSHEDVLEDSRALPDGAECDEKAELACDCSFELADKDAERRMSANSDCSTDSCSAADLEVESQASSSNGLRPRLAIFQAVAAAEDSGCSAKAASEQAADSEGDFENYWSQDLASVEALCAFE